MQIVVRNTLTLAVILIYITIGFAQSRERVSVLWVDPLKSIDGLMSQSAIGQLLRQVSRSGFQAVALGVKANNGYVLYNSKVAPKLIEWKGKTLPSDLDIIRSFIDQARAMDLQVYALFPVLAEGDMVGRTGTLYTEHPDWQADVYVVENETPQIIPITQWGYGAVAFASPLNTAVQNYQVRLLKELLEEYSFDGVVFDKLRFSGIEADFSEQARTLFESSHGKVEWWPEDVLSWQYNNNQWEVVPGKLFNDWLEFRASAIKALLISLVKAAKEADSSVPIANFVGAWYPTYYEYGVNWASQSYSSEEDWATDAYMAAAIADQTDYTVVGCFFPRITIQSADSVQADWWMSVEGSATLAMQVVNNATPVYGAILAEQFKGNPAGFTRALELAMNLTDGLYVTDASHLKSNNFWNEVRKVLVKTDPGLSEEQRGGRPSRDIPLKR